MVGGLRQFLMSLLAVFVERKMACGAVSEDPGHPAVR